MVELSTGVSPLGERDGGIVDWSFSTWGEGWWNCRLEFLHLERGMVELSTGVSSLRMGVWWNCQPEFSVLCGGGGMVDLNCLNG